MLSHRPAPRPSREVLTGGDCSLSWAVSNRYSKQNVLSQHVCCYNADADAVGNRFERLLIYVDEVSDA